MTHLDSVFQGQENIQALILSQVLHVDGVVDVTQLLGTESVGRVHLRWLSIKASPSLGGGSLQNSHSLKTMMMHVTHTQTFMLTHILIHTHIHASRYTYKHTFMHALMHTHKHPRTNSSPYPILHTHTHAHTHTHVVKTKQTL